MLLTFVFCGLAALGGGFMDAISGGGGLLTITSLLLCGVPPHIALGTNKTAAVCGLAVSFYKFSRTQLIDWKMALYGIPFMLAGSFCGARLALRLSPDMLGKVILALLPFAVAGILIPPSRKDSGNKGDKKILLAVFMLLLGCYDGFFGPASGAFLILGLFWLFGLNLIQASGTAKPFNFASTLLSSIYFIWHGAIDWQICLVMATCYMTGNWLGAIYAIKKGPRAVRFFLLLALGFLFASLIYKYFPDLLALF